jgi:hypothetical protein
MYSFVLLAIQKKQQSPKPLVKVAQDFSFHCPYARMQLSKHTDPLDVGPMLRSDFWGLPGLLGLDLPVNACSFSIRCCRVRATDGMQHTSYAEGADETQIQIRTIQRCLVRI